MQDEITAVGATNMSSTLFSYILSIIPYTNVHFCSVLQAE